MIGVRYGLPRRRVSLDDHGNSALQAWTNTACNDDAPPSIIHPARRPTSPLLQHCRRSIFISDQTQFKVRYHLFKITIKDKRRGKVGVIRLCTDSPNKRYAHGVAESSLNIRRRKSCRNYRHILLMVLRRCIYGMCYNSTITTTDEPGTSNLARRPTAGCCHLANYNHSLIKVYI